MENPENGSITSTSISPVMDRRKFCTRCIHCTTGMILLSLPVISSAALASSEKYNMLKPNLSRKEIKKLFMKKGSCSHLFLYLLNKEHGQNKADEERAIDQLAGGIAQRGYQCGMLWGTSMGASAEAFRKYQNRDQAMASAIYTSKKAIDAFVEITNSPDCYEIKNIDPNKRFGLMKMIFSAGDCFDLAHKWYQKAIKITNQALAEKSINQNHVTTCASEVIRKMGGNDEEMVMVSGFAGGLGLSGNGCGALSAVIWMKSLDWCRKNPEKKGYSYDGVKDIVSKFEEATQGEFICHKIAGRGFDSVEDHSEFIQQGGCEKIIELLAETKSSVD